ncbi:hypothetical protein B0H13DRAFT_1900650 [Mycena leptocephala]|nr:hypothetical protein B0H13DRAFT_1900650 [Mycena leptocephala]
MSRQPRIQSFDGSSVVGGSYILCHLCNSAVSKNCFRSIPLRSYANGLWIGKVPEELKDLTFLEEQCIARARATRWREKIIQFSSSGDIQTRAAIPDVKEHFECGREDDVDCPNIWLPDGTLPGFKEHCLEFFSLCYEVELNILRALALGFGLEEDYLTQFHAAADNQLRLLHYPR